MTSTAPRAPLQHYPDIERHRSKISLAVAHSGTPCFVGERANLEARYRSLDECLRTAWPRHAIAYSFKTNYLVANADIFRDLGAWAEVVSGREYRLARERGHDGAHIVYNGPYKSDAELQAALEDGALVNVNDHQELGRIRDRASATTTVHDIGLRVSCALPTLGRSRFGFSLDDREAVEALNLIDQSPYLRLVALHMHLHGDTDDVAVYQEAATRLGAFAMRCREHGHALRFLDVGGGFPAHTPKPKSRTQWNPQDIEVYIQAITEVLRTFFPDEETAPTLLVEPGRYLTADGIVFVTRVHHVKTRNERQLITCDGSISMVPLTHYCPQLVRAYTKDLEARTGPEVPTVIYGSTCRENDLLYEGSFVEVHPGDFLVHFAAGAYNSSMTANFIFAAPPIAWI